MKKRMTMITACMTLALLSGCAGEKGTETEAAKASQITIAAAASLENCFVDELIPMFEKEHENVTIEGTYDSSGKLQTQIENGLDADVFMSAAKKQMTALVEEELVDGDTVVDLLENKLVLIVPAKSEQGEVDSFETIGKAESIAIGDPESVPAGQYAEEALTNLGIWDGIQSQLSMGTNVTEVLSWVEAGSAEAGIVYATDAASSDQVRVVAEAPEGALQTPVIYPIGLTTAGSEKEDAKAFEDFLQSEEALKVFEKYGFTIQ